MIERCRCQNVFDVFWLCLWMNLNCWNSQKVVTKAACEQCGLNAIRPPVEIICEQCGSKLPVHVSYPSNNQKPSIMECFRHVLTKVLDALQFMDFCGSGGPAWVRKVRLERSRATRFRQFANSAAKNNKIMCPTVQIIRICGWRNVFRRDLTIVLDGFQFLGKSWPEPGTNSVA